VIIFFVLFIQTIVCLLRGEKKMQKEIRKPLPPFDFESATMKVKMAENGWNGKDAKKIAMAYTKDSSWRNRNLFINGRDEIVSFLQNKYVRELEYKLCKELWAYTENIIAVRFAYEWHDESEQWYRSYGNENWKFDENGLMKKRYASINDLLIDKSDRKFLWDSAQRPDNYMSLSEMEL
jgi:nuclear transport factor 2 (NTF2) superfamily protein